ncbi:hypothetical protein [Bacillus altitudinis]|uniref:hypothetical protein n=1 Tax=Bacillus altitudinis TaxID=293387 RepID=UPI003019AA6C
MKREVTVGVREVEILDQSGVAKKIPPIPDLVIPYDVIHTLANDNKVVKRTIRLSDDSEMTVSIDIKKVKGFNIADVGESVTSDNIAIMSLSEAASFSGSSSFMGEASGCVVVKW